MRAVLCPGRPRDLPGLPHPSSGNQSVVTVDEKDAPGKACYGSIPQRSNGATWRRKSYDTEDASSAAD
jgi:hypothetical protein